MANTTPDNISYPTNASTKKTIEGHLEDTATSIQTALNSKASLSGGNTFVGAQSVTGNITSSGELFAQDLSLTKNTAHIEIGAVGASNTPYIDFHSGGSGVDYDTRVIASGGTGSVGGGRLDIQSSSVYHSGLSVQSGNPSFQANKSTHTTASAYLVFDSVWHNTGGAYNSSNGRFTAPIAGRYLVTFNTLLYSMGSASNVYMLINGVQQAFMGVYGQFTGSYAGQSGSTIISLAANDYVQWYFTHNGTSLHLSYTNASAYFLG